MLLLVPPIECYKRTGAGPKQPPIKSFCASFSFSSLTKVPLQQNEICPRKTCWLSATEDFDFQWGILDTQRKDIFSHSSTDGYGSPSSQKCQANSGNFSQMRTKRKPTTSTLTICAHRLRTQSYSLYQSALSSLCCHSISTSLTSNSPLPLMSPRK